MLILCFFNHVSPARRGTPSDNRSASLTFSFGNPSASFVVTTPNDANQGELPNDLHGSVRRSVECCGCVHGDRLRRRDRARRLLTALGVAALNPNASFPRASCSFPRQAFSSPVLRNVALTAGKVDRLG